MTKVKTLDSVAKPIDTIQDFLNLGITPLEIYNKGVPVDSIYGKIYEGGLIADLNTSTGKGFVVTDKNVGISESKGVSPLQQKVD